ncbi:adenine phosphoribosyltransferase [Micromonospora chersina]|uniref:Adenine phosphoribosyltransferase n=1 Tax=Micromonospora chersina TaxID=47854 RepID=A0A1C6UJG0_9ACTN|nr:adenine phosphoribosyltransferase [Micromonospora terminaliae]SCL54132.1 adenine phosphoribosyltransferase [Micromonospora chersina]
MGRTVTETHTTGVRGDSGPEVARLVASRVLDVPDFPKPGVMFKDLMPLFADGAAFREVIDGIIAYHGRDSFDAVVGIEARGFVLAAAVAYATGVGVVPVRKAGKLPRATHSASYALEYGEATLEVHQDAFTAGHRVLVLDDVLATGGTAEATLDLVERAGGTVAGFTVLMELGFLKGRERLAPRPVHALLTV